MTVDRLKLSNIEIKYKYEENSEFKTQLSQRRNSTQYSEEEQAKVNNNNSQPRFSVKFMSVASSLRAAVGKGAKFGINREIKADQSSLILF